MKIPAFHIFQIVDGEVVQVGVGDALGAERDLAIKDWYAFVATGSGLSVMNVAVAENPYRAGFLNLDGDRLGIVHVDRFEILDITVPGTPILRGFHEIGSRGTPEKVPVPPTSTMSRFWLARNTS